MSEGRLLESFNQYFDDLQLGDRFESSRGRTVTEADITIFSGLSGDHHQLHTDEVYATTEGPFGGRIAQGTLTLALSTGLEFSLLGSGESRIVAFYGLDRVRFLKPVFIGDTIRLRGEIVKLEPKDQGRGVVTIHEEIVNQDGATVAVLDKRLLHVCRPAG